MKGVLGVEGHAAIQQRLATYLSSGRVHPALVLVGKNCELRSELANAIAKGLLCTQRSGGRVFCGACRACRNVPKEMFCDLKIIQDLNQPIKVEDVRNLCADLYLSPLESHAKVSLFKNADLLNSASSNALLKTLEEPLPGRYFILLVSRPSVLLPTIASRCVFFFIDNDRSQLQPAECQFDSVEQAVAALGERDQCTAFVHSLQTRCRDRVIELSLRGADSVALLELIDQFDAGTELQGKLLSTANHNLLLEIFLRSHSGVLEVRHV